MENKGGLIFSEMLQLQARHYWFKDSRRLRMTYQANAPVELLVRDIKYHSHKSDVLTTLRASKDVAKQYRVIWLFRMGIMLCKSYGVDCDVTKEYGPFF
jgi:hypothetical protein